jgi:signal transduction histidine kinase
MKNGVHSGVKSKALARMGTRAACRQDYGLPLVSEAFAMEGAQVLAESTPYLDECRAFAVAANSIREEEKARLARELHDELAQSLTALKMDTIWVRDNAAAGAVKLSARLTEMLEMLDRTVAATRRMASELRPLMLDDLGLVPAIEWLLENFTHRCGVPCRLIVDKEAELELQEPHATAVFRIVQESLNNVAKHARASHVLVSLEKNLGHVHLVVQDNGCGFLTKLPRKPQSLGLVGLRERAHLLDGHVHIKSAPGQGTCVEVSIPLPQRGAI